MPIVSTAKMTARQFLHLGDDPPGVRLELVNGEIAVSPSPVPGHSFTEKMLGFILMQHILSHDLGQLFGDVDTLFGPHDVRRPDLIFFAKSRLHLVGPSAMEGPPDLCVEIISPSSATVDRIDKFQQYAEGGVANYWIVDPLQHTVEGYRLAGNTYQLAQKGGDVDILRLPPFIDLELPLARLWRPESA
jgi:Uma2 family endonuclease